MKMIKHFLLSFMLATFGWLSVAQAADDEIGIFERINEASGNFADSAAALEAALGASGLTLLASHDLTYEDKQQQVRVYVLTSPAYMQAAAGEAPNTISAQILRVGIYEYGAGKKVHIDMANPVAHAMVFYSESKNYKNMVAAAQQVAQTIRDAAAKVPGTAVRVQLEPKRTEKTYKKFNGDGPAKMMAKFRNWEESQIEVDKLTSKPGDFAATVAKVDSILKASQDKGTGDSNGWSLITRVDTPNAVYFGISSKYAENKCIRINSDFRFGDKEKDAPYPGVDHAPALPLEVIVFNDGKETKVVQYGEMWRMQLYFWDSGYLAFAKNTLIPEIIVSSIEKTLEAK
jgi:hypothetical protein